LALALADGPQPGPADAITAAICIAPVVAGLAVATSELASHAARGALDRLRKFGDSKLGQAVLGWALGGAMHPDAVSTPHETGVGVGQVQEAPPVGRDARKKDEEQPPPNPEEGQHR
jgi:hypothetical protein